MVSLAFLAVYCVTATSEVVSYVALGSNFALEVIFILDHFKSVSVTNCSVGDKYSRLGQKILEGRGHFLWCFFL